MGTRTFYWYKRIPPSTTWNLVATTQDYSTTMGVQDFELKLEVHAGSETVYDTYYVQYDDGSLSKKMSEDVQVEKDFLLLQNYPNPFNPTTKIFYRLRETARVKIVIYDVLGRAVDNLLDETKDAGSHNILFDAKDLPSGLYMYRIVVTNNERIIYSDTRKMLLIK
ncbi:T9SS type A sorting domain-containing protein [Melioribacter sp. Ez-97]|uniref:T9SS type A sorting domain-containing protein n=1 Tax=Melioribacter sp. Ez-97 TaxID=3423434 RepID=UPI003EDB4695